MVLRKVIGVYERGSRMLHHDLYSSLSIISVIEKSASCMKEKSNEHRILLQNEGKRPPGVPMLILEGTR